MMATTHMKELRYRGWERRWAYTYSVSPTTPPITCNHLMLGYLVLFSVCGKSVAWLSLRRWGRVLLVQM